MLDFSYTSLYNSFDTTLFFLSRLVQVRLLFVPKENSHNDQERIRWRCEGLLCIEINLIVLEI